MFLSFVTRTVPLVHSFSWNLLIPCHSATRPAFWLLQLISIFTPLFIELYTSTVVCIWVQKLLTITEQSGLTMDPADPNALREAINKQGVLLGRHDSLLKDIRRSLQQMNSCLARVALQLCDRAAAAQPQRTVSRPESPGQSSLPPPAKEPFLPPPEYYSGDVGSCGRFLLQCSLVFDQQTLKHSHVAYIINLLRGKAVQWATALWVESGWNDRAVFLKGLSDEMKDELTTREEPDSLEELISLAIKIDNREQERRQAEPGHLPVSLLLQPSFSPLQVPHSVFQGTVEHLLAQWRSLSRLDELD